MITTSYTVVQRSRIIADNNSWLSAVIKYVIAENRSTFCLKFKQEYNNIKKKKQHFCSS